MGMRKELPIFLLTINDDLNSDIEVSYVSLVDKPAIEKNFVAFNEAKQSFAISNEDLQIISGPAMLADVPIYRNDATLGEYYVMFDKANIMTAAQKFFQKGFQNNINLFHDMGDTPQGVTVFESFVVDSNRGIKPMKGFEDANDGSWFISMKVDNSDVWSRIKAGELKGFSIEGMFGYKEIKMSKEEQILEQIKAILKMADF